MSMRNSTPFFLAHLHKVFWQDIELPVDRSYPSKPFVCSVCASAFFHILIPAFEVLILEQIQVRRLRQLVSHSHFTRARAKKGFHFEFEVGPKGFVLTRLATAID